VVYLPHKQAISLLEKTNRPSAMGQNPPIDDIQTTKQPILKPKLRFALLFIFFLHSLALYTKSDEGYRYLQKNQVFKSALLRQEGIIFVGLIFSNKFFLAESGGNSLTVFLLKLKIKRILYTNLQFTSWTAVLFIPNTGSEG
jgi:hypothetical protein